MWVQPIQGLFSPKQFSHSLDAPPDSHLVQVQIRINDVKGGVRAFDLDLDELKLPKRDPLLENECEICVESRQVKVQTHKIVPRTKKPLARVYMDFWGPNRDSMGDRRCYLSLIDDYSRFSWLYVMTDRRAESVMKTLDLWMKRVERQSECY